MSSEKIERLKNFYLQDVENQMLLKDLVDSYFAEDQLEALIEFTQSLESDLQIEPQIAHQIGIAGLVVGNYPLAETYFTIAFQAHPSNASIAYNLAYSKYAMHEFDDGLKIIESVTENWQDCPTIKLLEARCFHQTKKLESALESINAFVEKVKDHTEGLGVKSLILLDLGQYQAAEKIAAQVLIDDEPRIEPILSMTSSLIAQGRYEDSKQWIEQGIENHPKVGRLWQNKGQVEMLELQFEQAEKSLKTAVKNMPNHIGTWHLLGWTQLITENLAEARTSFEAALTIDRNFADSHGAMALMDILTNHLEPARESVKRSLKLDPRCATGLYAKSLLLEKDGQMDKAKAIIDAIFQSETGQNALVMLPQVREKFERLNKSDTHGV